MGSKMYSETHGRQVQKNVYSVTCCSVYVCVCVFVVCVHVCVYGNVNVCRLQLEFTGETTSHNVKLDFGLEGINGIQ